MRATKFVLPLLFCGGLAAQNLVPNPSFELKSGCPSLPGQVTSKCTSWISPNTGSPDYDNTCGTSSTVKVPTNMWGTQTPHSGNAYTQLITYVGTTSNLNFREYIQAKLTSPLVNGTQYVVSFWVSKCDLTQWAAKDIGALLTTTAISSTNFANFPFVPQVQNTGGVLTNATTWVQISGIYTATGGEQYITIGNFKNQAATTKQHVQSTLHNNAAYYIDDVSVTPVPTSGGGLFQTDHLIGFADLPAPATSGFIDVQNMDQNCVAAFTQCKPVVPVRALKEYAGGTAYDPRFQTVWISDGKLLAEFKAEQNPVTCKARCKAFKASIADPNAYVSGLAFADKKTRLFQLATRPGYMEVATYNASYQGFICPVKPVFCKALLPGKSVATGIAYDEVRDLVYISIAVPQANNTFQNVLWVAKASLPCKPICQTKFFTCAATMVTGLAYKTCKQILYATDGRITQPLGMVDPVHCKYKVGQCCAKQLSPKWRGLAVIPGWKSTTKGSSCTSGACPSCPTMQMETGGDPSLGATFKIGVKNGPAGSFGALFLKAGPAGTGIPLPSPFCGTWFAFPTALSFPATPLVGPGPCGAKAVRTLQIPVNPSFCGRQFTAQWFILCLSGSSFGLGLSNALEIEFASS